MCEPELYDWGARCKRCGQHLPDDGGDFCISCRMWEDETKETIEKLEFIIHCIETEER
jgi:rRNA maturation endonuclease Nob1